MQYLRPLLFLALLSLLSTRGRAQFTERLDFGAKFEPENGVLHGVGQNEEFAFANYVARMDEGRFPAIFMTYIPVRADAERLQRTITELTDMASYYPEGLAFQIGISMTTGAPPNNSAYTDAINQGDFDDNIDLIARRLDSLDRDIFLRIGYEANGFWNGYSADSYRPAFRSVAERFRAVSDRFAIVWCTHPITSLNDMMTYYPGDDVIDWWAIDWFQPSFMNNQATRDFLAEAIERERPVMIGEATPTEIGIGNGAVSWNAWYARFFELIRENPGIKAFCYINRDWSQISSLSTWGNALLEHDTTVLRLYREELDSELYVHLTAGNGFRSADLEPTDAVTVGSANPMSPGISGPLLTTRAEAGGDTTLSYFRFSLDTLVGADSLRVAKLWLAGKNETLEDIPFTVRRVDADWSAASLTYANRPATVEPLGDILVNDNRRNRLYWLDVSDLVRQARAEGRTSIAFLLGPPEQTDNTFEFHGTDREDGYGPALQLVFAGEGSVATATPPAQRFEVYPNPTDGPVRIEAHRGPATLAVTDQSGRLVAVHNLGASPAAVDLAGLPAGIYYLLLQDAEKSRVGRVVLR